MQPRDFQWDFLQKSSPWLCIIICYLCILICNLRPFFKEPDSVSGNSVGVGGGPPGLKNNTSRRPSVAEQIAFGRKFSSAFPEDFAFCPLWVRDQKRCAGFPNPPPPGPKPLHPRPLCFSTSQWPCGPMPCKRLLQSCLQPHVFFRQSPLLGAIGVEYINLLVYWLSLVEWWPNIVLCAMWTQGPVGKVSLELLYELQAYILQ